MDFLNKIDNFSFFGKINNKRAFLANYQAYYQKNEGKKVWKRRILYKKLIYKKPLLSTQERTPSTSRGSTRTASIKLTAFTKLYSHDVLTYSVLRLRSQPTRLTPMPPSKIAPGAGTV